LLAQGGARHTRKGPGQLGQQLPEKLESTQSSSPMQAGGSSGKSAARKGVTGAHAVTRSKRTSPARIRRPSPLALRGNERALACKSTSPQ